jgi:hypothetical protein
LSKTNIHEPLDPLNTVMKEGEDGFFESRDETAEELVLSMSYGPYAEFCSRFVLP